MKIAALLIAVVALAGATLPGSLRTGPPAGRSRPGSDVRDFILLHHGEDELPNEVDNDAWPMDMSMVDFIINHKDMLQDYTVLVEKDVSLFAVFRTPSIEERQQFPAFVQSEIASAYKGLTGNALADVSAAFPTSDAQRLAQYETIWSEIQDRRPELSHLTIEWCGNEYTIWLPLSGPDFKPARRNRNFGGSTAPVRMDEVRAYRSSGFTRTPTPNATPARFQLTPCRSPEPSAPYSKPDQDLFSILKTLSKAKKALTKSFSTPKSWKSSSPPTFETRFPSPTVVNRMPFSPYSSPSRSPAMPLQETTPIAQSLPCSPYRDPQSYLRRLTSFRTRK